MAVSPYIAKLREYVGHDMLLMPGTAVIPRDAQGRILLIRQTDSGQWAMIGGSMEPLETPEETALRETREEAGVDVRLDGVLGVFGGPDQVVNYPNGDVVAYVAIVFGATVVSGTPRPDQEETLAAGWFTPGEAADLDLSPNARATLSALRIIGSDQV
jgi:ADP-ribose pyrophosphatase YjhB (NUDIX family)